MPYSPDYSANPTGADLIAFLSAQGLWSDAYSGFEDELVTSAIKTFEAATDRRPFKSLPSQTLNFDPVPVEHGYPNRRDGVRFDLPIVFTNITAVGVYSSPANPSGTVLALGSDVILRPSNRGVTGEPIEWLQFVSSYSSGPLSIAVTGTPGSYDAWPEDAWRGVLASAGFDLLTGVKEGILAGPSSLKLGTNAVEQDFDRDLGLQWRKLAAKAIRRYTYVKVEP